MRPLCVAVDDNYVWPCLVQLHSGYRSGNTPFRVVLAWDPAALSGGNLQLLEDVADWLGIETTVMEIRLPPGLPVSSYITPVAYARLLLADQMQEPFIWMDSDVLLQGGWDGLLTIPSNGRSPVGAVPDKPVASDAVEPPNPGDNQARQRAGNRYLNSGVLAIDPALWRMQGLDRQWPEILAAYEDLGFNAHDQDILNFLVGRDYEILPRSFNCIVATAGAIQTPTVLHFAGQPKPWQIASLARASALRNLPAQQANWVRSYLCHERVLVREASEHDKRLAGRLVACQHAARLPSIPWLVEGLGRRLRLLRSPTMDQPGRSLTSLGEGP